MQGLSVRAGRSFRAVRWDMGGETLERDYIQAPSGEPVPPRGSICRRAIDDGRRMMGLQRAALNVDWHGLGAAGNLRIPIPVGSKAQ
jgi:hypothetical protein